jgi:hypothetical protein
MIRKFVTHDIAPLATYANTTMYKLHEKLEKEEALTREEKDKLFFFGSDGPVYKHMGYAYNFRQWLKKFYVEDIYGHISKAYAYDRTALRRGWPGPGIFNIADAD